MSYSPKVYYIDYDGNEVLDVSHYAGAGRFSEGLAVIRTRVGQYGYEGLCGYTDKTGTIAIDPQFFDAGTFSEGLAAVKLEFNSAPRSEDMFTPGFKDRTAKGFIDKTGKVVIETDCYKVADFSEGIAVAEKDDELFFIDKIGRKIHSLNGNEIYIDVHDNAGFAEGLIAARDENSRKCGFMDKTGVFVIEPVFENAADFSDGLARVSIVENHRERLGFINRKGSFVIPPKFDLDGDFRRNSTDFSEGLANVIDGPPTMKRNPHFMYIDKQGEIALRTDFFLAEPFHEGLAVVNDERTGNYGYINKSGELVTYLKFYRASRFSEGLALVA
jgi:hypothetical protein